MQETKQNDKKTTETEIENNRNRKKRNSAQYLYKFPRSVLFCGGVVVDQMREKETKTWAPARACFVRS
jgi:hypothetical protein